LFRGNEGGKIANPARKKPKKFVKKDGALKNAGLQAQKTAGRNEACGKERGEKAHLHPVWITH
jgi:hypothetical protein